MHHTHTHKLTQPCAAATRYLKPLLTLLFLAAIWLSNQVAANERNPTVPEITHGGTLMLSNATSSMEAVQLDAVMNVAVSGLLAQITLTQSFHNTSNEWMQARYLFPLPDSAAVQALTIKTGDKTIHGRIMKREEARETFESASDAGQITSLVEQQRPNLFSMDVATVAPDSQLSVTLTLMLPVTAQRTSRSLTIPTTHTPRYTNEITPQASNVSGAFTDLTQQRGPRLTLEARIAGIQAHSQISSDTHNLVKHENGVSLIDIPMDRDVVIRWPVNFSHDAESEIYTAEHAQERYAQILLNPPAPTGRSATVRRDLVMVVDKSGSMAGESIIAARKALQFALDSLKPDDHFNIIAFDDQSYPLFPHSRSASTQNLKLAQRFTNSLDAEGGTEMRESLDTAFSSGPNNEEQRLKQIVFLTDGSVGYEDALLLHIKRRLGDSRLFTIGIGSAPNQWFLNKAAEAGRGIALSIPDSYSAADAIEQLLTNLASPVITDVSVQFIGGRGEIYPNPMPDLYADKPRMLAARLSPGVSAIVVSGNRQANGEFEQWQQRLSVVANPPETEAVPAITLFWTRLKVASLLDEQRYATDPQIHKSTITQLAINAQLLSPYTSFVAVDEQPVRPDHASLHATDVASLIPHGNQMMNLVLPQGAAGVDTLGWISALLAMAGITMIILSRRQIVLHDSAERQVQ